MNTAFSSWSREARLLPSFVLLMLAACSSSDSPTGRSRGASTTLSVYLTDAPGDVSRVWLQISNITAVGSGGLIDLLAEPTDLIEVTALTGNVVALVQAFDIEPGSVQRFWFLIDGAVLETRDGKVFTRNGALHPEGLESTGELPCPSCSQSGISGFKIEGRVVLADGVQVPVCGGAQRSLDEFVPLAIARTLADDTGMPISFSGTSDDEGEVEISVLEGDTYMLSLADIIEFETGSLSFGGIVIPSQVTVGEQNLTVGGVTFRITSATCVEG